MNQTDNYLSEFEQAFDLDGISSENQEPDAFSGEFELEDGLMQEAETGDDSEFEMEHGMEDHEDMLYEYQHTGDYEERLYNAMNAEYETSYEMEQELDGVLREMELDYFWKPFKKLAGKLKAPLLNAVKRYVPGGSDAIGMLGSLAGGDLRGLLKNGLLKKGLTLAANAVAPGAGGMLAGALLNREEESFGSLRQDAAKYAGIAKNAYASLANALPNLKPGNIPAQIRALSKNVLGQAVQGGAPARRNIREIALPPGASVTVYSNRVVIKHR